MKRFLVVFITLSVVNSSVGAKLISLLEFTKEINTNSTFTHPHKRMVYTPSVYSLQSILLMKQKSKIIKQKTKVPKDVVNNFIKWNGIILKKQYINTDINNNVLAMPDVALFSYKTKDSLPVFTWKSDILFIQNNTRIKSYTWETGTFFAICILDSHDKFEDEKQVLLHIKSLLWKYTNVNKNNIKAYKTSAKRTGTIWMGKLSFDNKKYHSWQKKY